MALIAFIKKLNNKHFFSLAGNITISVLSLVTTAILFRFLPSQADVGTWFLFQTVLGLIDTARSGFLNTAVIRFYAGASPQRVEEVTGSTWYLATIISVTVLIINALLLFTIPFVTDASLLFMLQWLGLAFILNLPVIIANCTLQGAERFDWLLYMRAVNQVSFLVFIVALAFFKQLTLNTLPLAYLLTLLLTSLYVLLKGWTNLASWKKRTHSCIREIYNFGRFTVGTILSSILLRASDTFLIKIFFPPGVAERLIGIYRIGLQSLEIVEIPLRSFISTGMTTLSVAENQGNKNYFVYAVKKYTGILVMLIIPAAIAAWLLADVAVYVLAGSKYLNTEAANVIRIFMTFAILFPFDRFFAVSLDVLHQPRINYYKVIVMLIVNVLADTIGFYITKNIYGIALATLFPTTVGTWVGYHYLRKHFHFTFKEILIVGYTEAKQMVLKTLQLAKRK
jgi:O-antigen/teichoic acid export membrane protein